MAGTSLLTLLDGIGTILDDVAVMSKVAMKKTAGVLGDDLALNAQQVSGVRADRELAVVWAVAKGSAVNKLILVPAALAISALAPKLVIPLLMIGGLYLCFEGAEKLAHKFLHSSAEDAAAVDRHRQAVADPNADLVQLERDKIRGAIRTDFILSAEIIVIALGTVAAASFGKQVAVLCVIAAAMTVGVYGLVAGIVKLDDLGLYLHQSAQRWRQRLGAAILAFAPWLMKSLSVAGMVAMFLVGGGILVHGLPAVHHAIEHLAMAIGGAERWLGWLAIIVLEGLFGLLCGALVVLAITAVQALRARRGAAAPPPT
jgi:predicted DNA repair protein MutK